MIGRCCWEATHLDIIFVLIGYSVVVCGVVVCVGEPVSLLRCLAAMLQSSGVMCLQPVQCVADMLVSPVCSTSAIHTMYCSSASLNVF